MSFFLLTSVWTICYDLECGCPASTQGIYHMPGLSDRFVFSIVVILCLLCNKDKKT
uniref:Uncharacterized protein n=1 Tax=Setaria italica TaxID=4555 RepID=K3ZYZ6_SETIT